MEAAEFIVRWKRSGGAELANSQSFLKELCDLLGVPQPEPTVGEDEEQNTYVFEKAIQFNNGDGTYSSGRVDLYRKECFVLESKQGVERKDAEATEALASVTLAKKLRKGTAPRNTAEWERAMSRARAQAKRYAEALPDWPIFLVVVDVGHCFDLYADFSQSGKNYVPFPDPKSFRIAIDQLRDERVRERLKALWLDPKSLDPSRRAAQVTREIADKLARLAKSLEGSHPPEVVAGFLIRCLFTMFAEDIGLIPPQAFRELLLTLRFEVQNFVPLVEELWNAMDKGKFSTILRQKLRHFNGGFFEDHSAIPLTRDQLELLIESAQADWTAVEPAIFGTLLERALDPVERHKLGAHFTPRAYVERLVLPTIIEPLREEWESVYAAAIQLADESELAKEKGKAAESRTKRAEAQRIIRNFHGHLCEVRVLDPACGSGNFLYVSLELMKRLEGEVLNALREFGDYNLPGVGVDPHQFLGIEINPRAAAIAELVLWIGFLQWHYRTREKIDPPEPILKAYHNIECRDALLVWDTIEPVVDSEGKPVTRWDGRTTKIHPATGELIPDESVRVQELRYINPTKAAWPKADSIVGNPPFIGTARMRDALGDGYTKTVRLTYDEMPESCDYVMYWWHKAADLVRSGAVRRFGFIATNSLRQAFNRRIVQPHLSTDPPLRLAFAIPDHPWVDSADGAAVRISMTVGDLGNGPGRLVSVTSEKPLPDESAAIAFKTTFGKIHANLATGAETGGAVALAANLGLSNRGVQLIGSGFQLDLSDADRLRKHLPREMNHVIREYRNGKDLTQTPRRVCAIDLYGLSSDQVRHSIPEVFQWVLERVKPERDQNNRKSYRDAWWIFGEPRKELRRQLAGLPRYIVTVETSKHRFFAFLEAEVLPDNMLVCIAFDDAYFLGCLSSRGHVVWALASGGRLGVGNDPRYNKTRCFETFPFPNANETVKQRIRDLGEQLDAHRKRQQQLHPMLTMTGMYNVLEKLRSGEPLTAKEKVIHEQGLVSVLKQIHDDLDAAIFEAFGWPANLTDEEILERLVTLNHERAEEESRGIIRWLRPEFQNPDNNASVQQSLIIEVSADADEDNHDEGATAKGKGGKKKSRTKKSKADPDKPAAKLDWPKSLPDRIRAVRSELESVRTPISSDDMAQRFTRAPKVDVAEILETLVAVGKARQIPDGRYAA